MLFKRLLFKGSVGHFWSTPMNWVSYLENSDFGEKYCPLCGVALTELFYLKYNYIYILYINILSYMYAYIFKKSMK